MQKKILNAVAILWQTSLLILVFNVFINPGLWIYLLRQAKGQLTVIAQTRDVTPLLQSSALSETQKYKIRLIQEVKLYAETRLGLKKQITTAPISIMESNLLFGCLQRVSPSP